MATILYAITRKPEAVKLGVVLDAAIVLLLVL